MNQVKFYIKTTWYIFIFILTIHTIIGMYYQWRVLPINHINTVGRIVGKVRGRDYVSVQYITQAGDSLISSVPYPKRTVVLGNHLVIRYAPPFPSARELLWVYGLNLNEIPFGTELSDSILLEYAR